jgi:hypothetical protein
LCIIILYSICSLGLSTKSSILVQPNEVSTILVQQTYFLISSLFVSRKWILYILMLNVYVMKIIFRIWRSLSLWDFVRYKFARFYNKWASSALNLQFKLIAKCHSMFSYYLQSNSWTKSVFRLYIISDSVFKVLKGKVLEKTT